MEQSIAIDSTTDLHSAAVVMDSVADAVGRAVRVLADTLTLLGDPIALQHNGSTAEFTVTAGSSANPPWGTDSYGKSFADGEAGYVNLGTDLLQGGFDLAHTLSQFAHGMSRAAVDLDGTEENATAAFF
ncbi:hypothetical protein NONI108955_36625 [Nocardia ninae]|uniref:PE domain-containing protein n=1 Tax=Nocardia ninae NBRC 108245 TaxID=1210091 RepID=A0A511M7U6_9NOCA|nr:hypothetical protein [Nocardia ninae]GEM36725.1 hypothetical protein NN4_12440 [Nocardia ninae NBRC 108245]